MEDPPGDRKPPSPPPEPESFSEPDREVVFYYSRSRRLERASPAVQALNEGGTSRRPSFIGSLTATKPLAILFFTLMVVMAFGLILSFLSGDTGRVRIGGAAVAVNAFFFEGNTILVLKKTYQQEAGLYTGAVDLAVSPVRKGEEPVEEYPIWTQRLFFTLKNGEEYRFAIPFEVPELLVLLQTETGRAALKVKPR
jgi:hypothetical protein